MSTDQKTGPLLDTGHTRECERHEIGPCSEAAGFREGRGKSMCFDPRRLRCEPKLLVHHLVVFAASGKGAGLKYA